MPTSVMDGNDKGELESLRKELAEQRKINNGLKWELADAQAIVTSLSRTHQEICDAAEPYMNQIREARRGTFRYDEAKKEARYTKPKLTSKPRELKGFQQLFQGDSYELSKIYPAPSLNGETIAVQLHLYYEDLLGEFLAYLSNIPFPFDLYVSCQENADLMNICREFSVLENVSEIIVRATRNRGRDIAPVYVLFREEIAEHDLLLHIHSKKTLYTGQEQVGWRAHAMKEVCGSEMQVRRIIALFQDEWAKIGLVFPEVYRASTIDAHIWGVNQAWGKKLADEFGFVMDDEMFSYPVGSFFWVRTDAIKPLLDRNFTYEDFEDECGQTDGTLAHALERAIAKVTQFRDYQLVSCDSETNQIHFQNYHHKLFKKYYEQNKEIAKYWLSGFDRLSFDVFDTLITRTVFTRRELFEMLKSRLWADLRIDLDFVGLRERAEREARIQKGEKTDISFIYEMFAKISGVGLEIADQIKQMEINLEYELCIPRKDVQEIVFHLMKKEKNIFLLADTYFTSDIVERMLQKCGYPKFDKMLLSCETGESKRDSAIWKKILAESGEGEKYIHVGDDLYEDYSAPGSSELKIRGYPVLSGNRLYELSPLPEYMKSEIRESLSSRLFLGKLIQQELFNSPFALYAGQLKRVKREDLWKALVTPVLIAFMQGIEEKNGPEKRLLFVTDQGEALQRFYLDYYQSSGRRIWQNELLNIPRRSMRLITICSAEDVRYALMRDYQGSLDRLLEDRLGMLNTEIFRGIQVSMPEHIDGVMALLESRLPDYLEECHFYRTKYEKCLESVKEAGDIEDVLVDLREDEQIEQGLARILQHKVTGVYLQNEVEGDTRVLSLVEDVFCLPYEIHHVSLDELIKVAREYVAYEKLMGRKCRMDLSYVVKLIRGMWDTKFLPEEYQYGLI